MRRQTISVTEFKAKCLALLDEIGEHGGTITITKRGRPLATVKRAKTKPWKSLKGAWVGKIDIPDPLDVDLCHLRESRARGG